MAALLVLLVTLAGCAARPRMTVSNEKRTTDSVVIREVLRDTVVTVEADSSLVRALVECDSLGRARLRELREYRAGTRLPPPKVSIEDNVLTATASIDSMEIYLTLKERYRQDLKAEKRSDYQDSRGESPELVANALDAFWGRC